MKLDNTVAAVVTGGASGLGAATARALAAKGVKVAIFDLQEEKGKAIAAELEMIRQFTVEKGLTTAMHMQNDIISAGADMRSVIRMWPCGVPRHTHDIIEDYAVEMNIQIHNLLVDIGIPG